MNISSLLFSYHYKTSGVLTLPGSVHVTSSGWRISSRSLPDVNSATASGAKSTSDSSCRCLSLCVSL